MLPGHNVPGPNGSRDGEAEALGTSWVLTRRRDRAGHAVLGGEEELWVLERCSCLEKIESRQKVVLWASWLACLALLQGETSLEVGITRGPNQEQVREAVASFSARSCTFLAFTGLAEIKIKLKKKKSGPWGSCSQGAGLGVWHGNTQGSGSGDPWLGVKRVSGPTDFT